VEHPFKGTMDVAALASTIAEHVRHFTSRLCPVG